MRIRFHTAVIVSLCLTFVLAGTGAAQRQRAVTAPEQQARNVALVSAFGGALLSVAADQAHVYVGQGNHLLVLSADDPANPHVLGQTPALPDSAYGIAVAGSYAYVAAYRAGLRVIAVVDSAHPHEVGALAIQAPGEYGGEAAALAAQGDLVYVAARLGGLRIVDVTDPTSPQEIGAYHTPDPTYLEDVQVAEGYAYIAAGYRGLRIVDVSDPADPREVSVFGDSTYVGGVALVGHYAYTNDRIVDVSDPAHPVQVNTCPEWTDLAVAGQYAYLVDDHRFAVLDVSDPAHPAVLSSVEAMSFRAVAAFGLQAYAINGDHSVHAYDASAPAAPYLAGRFCTRGCIQQIAIGLPYVFSADSSGLEVIDVSNPAAPSEAAALAVPGGLRQVMLSGHYAYATPGNEMQPYLRIVDVAQPITPTLAGTCCAELAMPSDIAVAGDHAYIADFPFLHVVDVSNPVSPTVVSAAYLPVEALLLRGTYLYAVAGGDFMVLDVSNPLTPTVIGTAPSGWAYTDIAVEGEFAYLAETEGVAIIDISDPTAPSAAGYVYSEFGAPLLVAAAGGRLYAGNSIIGGLTVWDLSTPSVPQEVGYYELHGETTEIMLAAGDIYVADDCAGLFILRYLPHQVHLPLTTR